VAEQFAGSYHSVFKGRGIEFAQVREYVPGDDVRLIDWNATARFGKPFVKLFTEERELRVMLLVDVSASMGFGARGRLKRQLAAEFCAAIAFAALTNNDQVGLILFDSEVRLVIPAKKGRRHILRLLHQLLTAPARGPGSRLDGALQSAARLLTRQGTVFLVSDFLVPPDESEALALKITARRHDLVAVTVRDPLEMPAAAAEVLPSRGLYRLEDPETGQTGLVDLGHAPTRQALLARQVELEGRRLAALRAAAVDQIQLRTDQPLAEPVIGFFRRRARHLRQGV